MVWVQAARSGSYRDAVHTDRDDQGQRPADKHLCLPEVFENQYAMGARRRSRLITCPLRAYYHQFTGRLPFRSLRKE